MKKIDFLNELKRNVWWILGTLTVLVMLIPYLILGEDSIIVYHDQLDGELLAYIFQAKHLFQKGILPEFMGGMEKTALLPPAPMCVLLFCTGHYFGAYVFLQIAESFLGFLGIYLLGRDIAGRKWIGTIVGILYAYLPFRPVYGLAQYGLPLLVWCIWRLCGSLSKRQKFLYMGYCLLYALNSSLVLIGFAVMGFLTVLMVCRKKNRNGTILTVWGLMLAAYIIENWSLLAQILGGVGDLSHKTEYQLYPVSFWTGLCTAFLQGMQYSEDHHFLILLSAIPVLFCRGVGRKARVKKIRMPERCKKPPDDLTGWIFLLLGVNFLLALISAFWSSGAGIAVRNQFQSLKGFQFGRVLWLAPAFWYMILICVLGEGEHLFKTLARRGSGKNGLMTLAAGVTTGILVICLGILGWKIAVESNLKPNLQKVWKPGYDAISYSDYYALGVMDQVREFLDDTSGRDVSQYRVVSLGIDPAAAYYAGFYCLDGYSNNYSLEYKHHFRRIIVPELEKNQYLTENFDRWGNRCYLFSAECPGYYTIEKNGFYFQDYDIDTTALRELGGKYLLSAAYIMNGEETGLRLMREKPFETEGSYYRIFVYEITEDQG